MRNFDTTTQSVLNSNVKNCGYIVDVYRNGTKIKALSSEIDVISIKNNIGTFGDLNYRSANAAELSMSGRVSLPDSFFMGTTLKVSLTFTSGSNTCSIKMGEFVVGYSKKREEIISIKAYDYMSKFDKYCKIDVTFPTTAAVIIQKICAAVGVSYNSTNIPNMNIINNDLDLSDSSMTYRNILMNLCEIGGVFPSFDENGVLQFILVNETGKVLTKRGMKGSISYDETDSLPPDYLIIRSNKKTVQEINFGTSYGEQSGFGEDQVYYVDNNIFVQAGGTLFDSSNLQNSLQSLSYTPVSWSSYIHFEFELGDYVSITNSKGEVIKTLITGFEVNYRTGGTTVSYSSSSANYSLREQNKASVSENSGSDDNNNPDPAKEYKEPCENLLMRSVIMPKFNLEDMTLGDTSSNTMCNAANTTGYAPAISSLTSIEVNWVWNTANITLVKGATYTVSFLVYSPSASTPLQISAEFMNLGLSLVKKQAYTASMSNTIRPIGTKKLDETYAGKYTWVSFTFDTSDWTADGTSSTQKNTITTGYLKVFIKYGMLFKAKVEMSNERTKWCLNKNETLTVQKTTTTVAERFAKNSALVYKDGMGYEDLFELYSSTGEAVHWKYSTDFDDYYYQNGTITKVNLSNFTS